MIKIKDYIRGENFHVIKLFICVFIFVLFF